MNLLNILALGEKVNTKFLVLLVLLVFIDYAGYGYYFFYLSLIYLFLHNGFRFIDKNFFILVLFGISYGGMIYLNTGSLIYVNTINFMVNMPVLYLIGKYLAYHNNQNSLIVILFLIVVAFALIPIISILQDVSLNGFYSSSGSNRVIPMIDLHGMPLAATALSSKLMPLAFFYILFLLPYKFYRKAIMILFSLISLFCLLRIQSRTSIFGCTLLLICFTILTWKSRTFKQKFFLLFGIFFIIGIVIYVLAAYSDQLGVLNRLEEDNLSSGGGRLELKLIVIDNIFNYPFGGMDKEIAFAHDLWFDTARVSGLLPFILIIYLTFIYLRKLFLFVKNTYINFIAKMSVSIVSYAIFLVFLAEPVLTGVQLCFGLFCLVFGIIESYTKNYRTNCE